MLYGTRVTAFAIVFLVEYSDRFGTLKVVCLGRILGSTIYVKVK